jgi:hypothetical protein
MVLVCVNLRVCLALLLVRIDDAERTNEHLCRTQSLQILNPATHRFFFAATAGFRAGGGSEESDGIESSEMSSSS